MSSTFISLVGFQPSAIAVCLKSWMEHCQHSRPISRILFLSTKEASNATNRLTDWINQQYPNLAIEEIPISSSLVAEANCPPPSQAIGEWLDKNPDDEIIFNTKSGLNPQIAVTVRQLPINTLFLSPMVGKVYRWTIGENGEEWDEMPLVDLGMDLLLRLYRISYKMTNNNAPSSIPQHRISKGIVRGLSLANTSNTTMEFDLAFEKGGYLYVLRHIEGSKSADRMRQFRYLHSFRRELNNLQPMIAVYSSYPTILERANRTRNFIGISSKGKQTLLFTWLKLDVQEPGYQEGFIKSPVPKRAMSFSDLAILKQELDISGKGGKSPSLAVCLGNDPSSTLISLCTHKPKKTWIFYDANTSVVVEAANRLTSSIDSLPVGKVEFIKTDIKGEGIASKLHSLSPHRVDISPGTKEQGIALMLGRPAQVWSLNGRIGKADCITDSGNSSLDAPDILTQAYCVGGELKGMRKFPPNQHKFHHLLARFMLRYLIEKKDSGEEVTNLDLSSRMECQNGYFQPYDECVKVELDGKDESILLRPENRTGGYWFEVLVANAVKLAGADEVRVGIKWAWSMEISNDKEGYDKYFKDEIDVLCKFKHRFIAISCKTGDITAAQERRIISSVAKNMGNFCTPVLAKPLIGGKAMQWSEDEGVSTLDLRCLSDSVKLTRALNEMFRTYSTQSR